MQKYYRAVTKFRIENPSIVCKVCNTTGDTGVMDPHHPKGRIGDSLYMFFMVHRQCHIAIHQFPEHSIKQGWLQ